MVALSATLRLAGSGNTVTNPRQTLRSPHYGVCRKPRKHGGGNTIKLGPSGISIQGSPIVEINRPASVRRAR
jgi:hypothetical protein